MNYRITAPERVMTTVFLPASKSISNRAFILSALSGSEIEYLLADCDDTKSMLKALSNPNATTINVGAAGTAMRFLTAYYATQEGKEVTIDGTMRMRQRPIKVLVDALRACGADIEYAGEEGFPPLRIKGRKLKCEEVEISGKVSSQYISAILMIAPKIEGLKRVKLTGEVVSRPYIAMTLRMMNEFGVKVKWDNDTIEFEDNARYTPTRFMIEHDWSAASYWFEIAALIPHTMVTMHHLFAPSVSMQGDAKVADIFLNFGVVLVLGGSGQDVINDSSLKKAARLDIDMSKTPDLAQTVVVTSCLLDIPFRITGLQTLKIKETDRIEALRTQLLKMGYVIEVGEDLSLMWDGKKCKCDEEIRIDTFEDHRMAMAFAPAAVKYKGVIIKDIEVVSKSYPNYWRDLEDCGFVLEKVK